MTTKPLLPMRSLFGWSTLGLILILLTQTTFAQSFAGGDGTQANPYQIADWNHLNNIRNHLSSDFILNNDLTPDTAGYTTHVKNGATLANGGQGWDPIGECVFVGPNINCTEFTGTFDGQHRAIVGLELARPTSQSGLFGRIGSAGRVQDLSLANLEVSGGQTSGGLAGFNGGMLSNVSIQGQVTAVNGQTGGAVGYNSGTLSRVGFYGTVDGDESTGGLVGINFGNIEQSWARVQVTSNSIRVGGAVGNNQGSLDRVFTSGQVTGLDLVGGLVGETYRNVSRGYAQTQVTASNGSAGGLIGKMGGTITALSVSQSYATGLVSGNSDSRGLVGNATRPSGSASFTVTDSFWDVDASGFGSVGTDDVGAIGKTTSDMKTQTTFTNAGWDFTANTGDWLMVDTATYPIFQALAFAGGEGTSASPYQIAHWEHLNNIRIKLDSHFMVSQDLDPFSAGYTTHVKNGATLANGGLGWQPIGKNGAEFTGVLDGAGHSVSDLEIARSAEPEVGLFGAMGKNGSIQNFQLLNASVEGSLYTGALVGRTKPEAGVLSNIKVTGQVTSSGFGIGCLVGASHSSITNAHVVCTVVGDTEVGGLVGDNDSDSLIERSSSAGSVSGTSSVGGLLGSSWRFTSIEESFSHSDVTANSKVGGLIGENLSSVVNTYATGTVTGTDGATTGGLIGINGDPSNTAVGGDVSNSYAAGAVNGSSAGRGFLGTSTDLGAAPPLSGFSASYSNNFFDTDTSNQTTATAASATALTTSQMKTQTTFTNAGWDFTADTGVWAMEQGTYLSYPYLQGIAYDSPGTSPATQPIPGLAKLPGAPTSVSATATNAQATVEWTAPADSGDSAVTAYTVTSSPDGQTCTTNGATSCTVTGLTNGTSYTFTVSATSSVGTGPASAPSTAVTPATVPGAPAITLTSADNAQASIEFSAPVSNGGAVITGYTATSNPGGLTGSCSASPCVVSDLVNGLEYTFTLTATNQAGTGAPSSPSSAVTPKTTPTAPTNVAASPGSGQARIHFDAGDNGGDAISNYAYSLDGGNTWTARVPAATTSPWIIEGLTNGTEYSVKIRAINSVGEGLASETVVVCPSASVFKDQFRSQVSAAPRCL